MRKSNKELLADQSVPISTKINDYFAAKVVDWSLKNFEKANGKEFKWDLEDKRLLTQIFKDPKSSGINLPMKDSKFKRFVFSIIENGLNSGDVSMFQRYKDRLPLRSLGLAYDMNDFVLTKNNVKSKATFSAGFYMLEIKLDPKVYSANIQLEVAVSYENDDQNDAEANSFKLRAKAGSIAKRLLWLRQDASVTIAINSQQSDIHPKTDVTHLRLARLTKSFFISRLFRKIGKDYDVDKHSAMTDAVLLKHWNQYDAIFKRVTVANGLRPRIGQSSLGQSAPTPDEQMRRILELIRSR